MSKRKEKTEADLKGWMIGRLDLLKQYTDRWEEGYEDWRKHTGNTNINI